ncbi:MAG: flagellar biosynthesis protein FlgJ [Rhodospirillales bacterium]|nr:flagellar biosynthesis protein FlgJ [Rhodospirillales bacterium]
MEFEYAMSLSENIINNNALAALTRQAAPQVISAIKTASAKTGVDFAYLVEQAAAESGFKAGIKSTTSSATGLYQFIESTWLNMVEKYGDKYGLGDLASRIKGGEHKQNAALKQEILDLRKDPKTASVMAAEFAAENQRYMESQGVKDIGSVELYLAHFMGAGSATAFLKANEDAPLQTAADLFPKAARANRNVFYDSKTGQARTLAGVYDFFAKKFEASTGNGTMMADNAPSAVPPHAGAIKATNRPTSTAFPKFAGFSSKDAVLSFISHPALKYLSADGSDSWVRRPLMPQASLIASPVELMMLARLETPERTRP